jgi:hypothetical protein
MFTFMTQMTLIGRSGSGMVRYGKNEPLIWRRKQLRRFSKIMLTEAVNLGHGLRLPLPDQLEGPVK